MTHAVAAHDRGEPPPVGSEDLRGRLYSGLCLASAVLSAGVVGPVNAIQDLPPIVNIGTAGFALFSLGLYLAARRGRVYPSTFLAGLLAVLNVGWFPNAGSEGSIVFYFFAAVGLPVIFFAGWRRWLLFALVVGNALALFAVEAAFPDLVRHFQNDHDRLVDLMTNTVVACVVCAIVLRVVINGYLHERERLKGTLADLGASQASLAALIDSTDEIVWLVDADGFRLKAYNRAFADGVRAALGLEVRPGLAPGDLMPAEAALQWTAYFDRALREGPFTIEYVVPANQQILLHAFSPVRHDGRAVGVSVFGRDITARKRSEREEARRAQQRIESQRLESLGRLAGGVAHDFNNMLGAIMGHADLLLAGESDDDRRGQLASILTASQRSADLVGKLLAFGRRGKNLVEAVQVNAVVRDCVAMLKPSIAREVDLSLELDATWTVDGDPSQLHQVVVNLCINALDAMTGGGRLTVVTADTPAPDGDRVTLRVSDTGLGMSDDVKARIFEPFFTTKGPNASSGMGLGLSTVHGIVHLHQGTIDVASSPGRGATFTVSLPRGRLERQASPDAVRTVRGHGTVLVVEDEPQLRTFTARALGRLGYQSLTAADGEEGVRVFLEHRDVITAVLLDLKMPRKGGRDAFLDIHAAAPTVPVLICSGYGDNEEVQSLITLGARGMLPKPYRLADLAERLLSLHDAGDTPTRT